MTSPQPALTFQRDRFTWLTYGLLGFFAFAQAALGPAMPYLREELGLNFTLGGLHITVFAVGMILAAVTSTMLARRIGRRNLFWVGSLGMALGALLFITARIAPLTLFASFLMGYMGTYLLVMIQATLSDKHQHNRATALTEANIVASLLAALGPVVLAAGASTPITWRLVYIVAILMCLTYYVTNRNISVPLAKPRKRDTSHKEASLPRTFWLIWLVMVLGIGVEWSVVAWTADYLATALPLPQEQASGMVGVFLGAMVVGRFFGSRLTKRFSAERLLWGALTLAIIGFLMLILTTGNTVPIIGLMICGLGVANMFPMGLSIASDIGAEKPDLTSSYISLAGGFAILIAPQVLGSLADIVGIQSAYAAITVLLAAYVVIYGAAQWLRH